MSYEGLSIYEIMSCVFYLVPATDRNRSEKSSQEREKLLCDVTKPKDETIQVRDDQVKMGRFLFYLFKKNLAIAQPITEPKHTAASAPSSPKRSTYFLAEVSKFKKDFAARTIYATTDAGSSSNPKPENPDPRYSPDQAYLEGFGM